MTMATRWTGSSPHGRGTRTPKRPAECRLRFIPARAGNTAPASIDRRIHAVHPRTGGEHWPGVPAPRRLAGSSPHGRGTLMNRPSPAAPRRFIPARAGNTAQATAAEPGAAVHPRTGGEHSQSAQLMVFGIGSSPHGRGTHRAGLPQLRIRRFIPARAGNTSAWSATAATRSVHPRTGGEHGSPSSHGLRNHGSSPHGRGTRRRLHARRNSIRFIPARAGNTCAGVFPSRKIPVHPRTGGEHLAGRDSQTAANGSSPHGRGTPMLRLLVNYDNRFIPARAGNTPAVICQKPPYSVHPRTGGEHTRHPSSNWYSSGSSPHGRGTRSYGPCAFQTSRFIPARAGNTARERNLSRIATVHPRTGGEH